jgi:hypothetical protein
VLRIACFRLWSLSNFLGRCRVLCIYKPRGLPPDGIPPAPAGLHPPNLDPCRSIDDVAEVCSAEYLTHGLTSLRMIPSGSVDFVWSNAVLPYVRRNEILPFLRELRSIQRPDGIGSHCIPIKETLSVGS